MRMHAGATRCVTAMGGTRRGSRCARRPGFSVAELLVVMGVLALLLSIMLPPLKLAHRHALRTRCGAQLQQIGLALSAAREDTRFFPLWEDNGAPKRYTWIDLLVQRGYLANCAVGYCPEDPQPSPINAARAVKFNLLYPGELHAPGIDYSYGLGMPLSAAGWVWRSGLGPPGDLRERRLVDHERHTAQRILAADSNWSVMYNFSADAMFSHNWNYPTQFDNTVEWRHANESANLLFQDGHVVAVRYVASAEQPVNTMQQFFWYPGEPLHVGPSDSYQSNFYPNAPPASLETGESGGLFPREMAPGYYTSRGLWTKILHK